MPEQYSFAGMAPPLVEAASVFFAIYPDANDAARATSIAEELRGRLGLSGRLRPLHVSLHYLGDRAMLPDSKIEAACRIAASIAFPPFEITFDRVTSFGSGGNAPVVMRGTDDVTALVGFWQTLGLALQKEKILKRLGACFVPHMTLLYNPRRIDERAIEPFRWTAREFRLVQSRVGQGEHVTLARWPLDGQDRPA